MEVCDGLSHCSSSASHLSKIHPYLFNQPVSSTVALYNYGLWFVIFILWRRDFGGRCPRSGGTEQLWTQTRWIKGWTGDTFTSRCHGLHDCESQGPLDEESKISDCTVSMTWRSACPTCWRHCWKLMHLQIGERGKRRFLWKFLPHVDVLFMSISTISTISFCLSEFNEW